MKDMKENRRSNTEKGKFENEGIEENKLKILFKKTWK